MEYPIKTVAIEKSRQYKDSEVKPTEDERRDTVYIDITSFPSPAYRILYRNILPNIISELKVNLGNTASGAVPKTSSDNDLSDWIFITKQHPEIIYSIEEGRWGGKKKKERKATVFLFLSLSLFFFFAHLFFKTVRSFQYFKSEENSLPAAVFEVVMVSKSHD